MRPPARQTRGSSAAPPTTTSRQAAAAALLRQNSGAVSPAGSVVSVSSAPGGVKRKERDFERDGDLGGGETNINVVVRCRGRNEREVKENSGVVVTTDGVKGNSVELSMGPTALTNKTYHFDKVFSPAADQSMVYDEVVSPILDEVCSDNDGSNKRGLLI
jgi:kinesin family member 11